MRKSFWISMIAAFAFAGVAGAQTFDEAYSFASMEYSGTARSIALGNAMTAVGGDLGSLTLNPAGSAVAGYGQFTITPGVTISSVNAVGTPLTGSTTPYSYGDNILLNQARMTLPNIGFMLNYNLGNRYGLKSISFGFVGNQTNNFLQRARAKGSNSLTSLAGAIAYDTDGYRYKELEGDNAYNNGAAWRSIVGYQSGMISNFGGFDDAYLGVTEKVWPDGNIGLAGDINQEYNRYIYGNKYDFLLNFGANFNDNFYIGANLGLATITYNYKLSEEELSVDPSKFGMEFDDGTIKYFDSFLYRDNWKTQASGAYFKVGFIAKPASGIRFGAAIQTPTIYAVRDTYAQDAQVWYTDGSDSWAQSPEGEYSYFLTTPFRANAGLALTFGPYGLISADYELCNFSHMRFRDSMYQDDFDDLNDEIRQYMGLSHEIRVGLEIKPTPGFALRAGYDFTTSPEKLDASNYVKANRHIISGGLGYSSSGSFFADLAVKATLLPNDYVMPYEDYMFTASGSVEAYSPEIEIRTRRIGAVLTLGWRF